MRLGTNDIAPDEDVVESATACPLLDRFDKPTADAEPALALAHNQTQDLAAGSELQKFLLGAMCPPHHLAGRFRHEDCMRIQREEAGESFPHRFAANRITECAA